MDLMSQHKVSEVRSRTMRAVRSRRNESTELAFARVLREHKITGWRRHLPLSGRPDFSWPSLRIAVFVDGCFWHGCPRCYTSPKTNKAFWVEKVESNRRRDKRVTAQLRRMGWKVVRIWECRVASGTSLRRLQEALLERLDDVAARRE